MTNNYKKILFYLNETKKMNFNEKTRYNELRFNEIFGYEPKF